MIVAVTLDNNLNTVFYSTTTTIQAKLNGVKYKKTVNWTLQGWVNMEKGKGKGKAEHLYSALHGLRPL